MNAILRTGVLRPALVLLTGMAVSGANASFGPVGGVQASSENVVLRACDASLLHYVDGLIVDEALVESVALWDVLDWGTCSTADYIPNAGRYYFTEASAAYSSLRTYFMTAEECSTKPCKSGYRYTVRYRSDLDIDSQAETIEGETKVYYVTEVYNGPVVSSPSLTARQASLYTVEAVYAGKVTFSVDVPTFGGFAEPSYAYNGYDAEGDELYNARLYELIDVNAFCAEIAEDLDQEIEDRVSEAQAYSGGPLGDGLTLVADVSAEQGTISGLSSNALIETSVPAAVQSVDAVLRGHVATWICASTPAGPGGGGTGLPGGTGTVQIP